MSYDSIPSGWRDIAEPIKKELIDLIHDNLEDLNGRVTNVEGAISTTVIANELVERERDAVPVGSMVWSPLSESDFQAQVLDGSWELADGQTVSSTDYATVVGRSALPDVRGKFLRMRAHGTSTTYNADGDVATDTYQNSTNIAHTHVMTHGHAHTITATGSFASTAHTHTFAHVHEMFDQPNASGGSESITGRLTADPSSTDVLDGVGGISHLQFGVGDPFSANNTGFAHDGFRLTATGPKSWYTTGVLAGPSGTTGSTATTSSPSATSTVGTSGSVTNFTGSTASDGNATESRPHNVTENLFVKTNKNYVTTRNGYFLWRAPQSLTINQVVLTPVNQGTSGSLVVDVKQGPLSSITTSIFSSAPSLGFAATTPQTGTINPTNAQVAAGDYVRIDITSVQAKLTSFHILIAATPT